MDVELTQVQVDPIGNLFWAALYGFHDFIDLPNLFEFWSRFQALNSYFATTPRPSTTNHPLSIFAEDEIVEGEMEADVDKLPSDVLSVQAFDPYVVGVNTMLFMFYFHIFCECFLVLRGGRGLGVKR